MVHSRAQIAFALAELRRASGETCEGLDARIGWADRYTAKMEHGDAKQGRQGFRFLAGTIKVSPMADLWLEAYGLKLVLMDTETAERLGAVPAPQPPASTRGDKRNYISIPSPLTDDLE